MKSYETDVVVVAAGLSGLAASISAAENGARVITVEKSNTTGGAANMGMGPLGVGSRIQRMQMVSLTPGEAFRKHMYFTHYRVDARIVRDYYFKSGETIDWLEEMGVEFVGVQRAFGAPEDTRAYSDGEFTWHVVRPEDGGIPGPRAATAMTKKMTERAKELGVEFMFETPAKKILMEDGKAAGVIAVDKDGEEVEIKANSVIIATGGFGENPGQNQVRPERLFSAAEDDGVPAFNTDRRRVGRHVRTRLVDEKDDAQRNAHLLNLQTVRTDGRVDHLADRVGEHGDLSERGRHGGKGLFVETEPVDHRRRKAVLFAVGEIFRVFGDDFVFPRQEFFGGQMKPGVFHFAADGGEPRRGGFGAFGHVETVLFEVFHR